VAYFKTEIPCYINEKTHKSICTVVVWIKTLLIPVYYYQCFTRICLHLQYKKLPIRLYNISIQVFNILKP